MRPEREITRLGDLEPIVVNRLPAILEEVRDLLGEQHPDYAAFLAEQFNEGVTASQGFVHRLISLAEQPANRFPNLEPGVEQVVFEEIGRVQYQQGRDVTSLLSAYRMGARGAGRAGSETALGLPVQAQAFASLASTIFAIVDQLSEASLRGYLLEQADAVRTQERLRDELTELLLSDRADMAAVRAAANRAQWLIPPAPAGVLVAQGNE